MTYKPGEKAFYYARYPLPWSGLVGFNSSYGSEQFTDNHFHYGYLVNECRPDRDARSGLVKKVRTCSDRSGKTICRMGEGI